MTTHWMFRTLLPIFAVFCLAGQAVAAPGDITLDTVEAYGSPRKAGVVFDHDAHSRAEGLDCTSCHSREGDVGPLDFRFSPVVSAAADLSGPALMDAWHSGCGTCHTQRAEAGKSTGPRATDMCVKCHNGPAEPVASDQWASGRMTDDVHTDHMFSEHISTAFFGLPDMDENCAVCHHMVLDDEKIVPWESGLESACADCHGAKSNVPSVKTASHTSCLSCHSLAPEQAKLPVACADCHSAS